MTQLFSTLLVAIVAFLSGAQAHEHHRLLWGKDKGNSKLSHHDWSGKCPEPPADAAYSKECYEKTAPPPFVCKNMKPDDWVKAALDSYPRCCNDDLSECRCPVKDWVPNFNVKIKDYCSRVETCHPGTSGAAPLLRGVEGANEQIQRKELSP